MADKIAVGDTQRIEQVASEFAHILFQEHMPTPAERKELADEAIVSLLE